MDREACEAMLTIRACVGTERYRLLPHFTQQMDKRGLFWPDVQAILDDPKHVRSAGVDRYNRPKWRVSGTAANGEVLELVCALDVRERGEVTVFITMY